MTDSCRLPIGSGVQTVCCLQWNRCIIAELITTFFGSKMSGGKTLKIRCQNFYAPVGTQWPSFTKCEIFRGQRRLAHEIWASEKVDFEWVENGTISPFVDQSSPNLVGTYGSDHSVQPLFRIDDILFQSGDICNEVAKWRSWKQRFLPPKFLGVRTPKIRCGHVMPIWWHIK